MGEVGTGLEPEPTTEPEPIHEPEPEPEPSPEPEPNPEGGDVLYSPQDPEGEPKGAQPATNAPVGFAEPVPKWDVALELYGKAWEFHIYFTGVLFALLAIYSLVSIVRLRKKRLLSRGYFVSLNMILFVIGVDRAIYMFVDAYNHKNIFPLPVTYLMLGMGFPCLTSAFSILFLALLQSTKTQLVSPKIQKPSYLAGVITIHFLISLISDTLLGFFAKTFLLTLICQVTFIVWGLFLSISFLVIFRRLYRTTNRLHRESVRLSMSKRSISKPRKNSQPPPVPRNTWGSAIKITLLIAFMGILTAILQLYGLIVVYSPVAGTIPEPWPWWGYQFTFRCVELVMCFTMSFVATQPFRYDKHGKEKSCCGFCPKRIKKLEDDPESWKQFYEESPAETFLPKSELDKKRTSQGSQTKWGPDLNDAATYTANSFQKLLPKKRRYKGLKKTYSSEDLKRLDTSKMKVTSQSFSSFGMFFSDEEQDEDFIHNDLWAELKNPKNKNLNANPDGDVQTARKVSFSVEASEPLLKQNETSM